MINDKIFDDYDELFQIESVENYVVYACNVCNEGFDREEDMKKNLICTHKEFLEHINKESDTNLINLDREKKIIEKSERNHTMKVNGKKPFIC